MVSSVKGKSVIGVVIGQFCYARPRELLMQLRVSENCRYMILLVAGVCATCIVGDVVQWMNQGAFLMRGVDNVRAEFSLTALVYNLRRALNILGVETMMAAVRD